MSTHGASMSVPRIISAHAFTRNTLPVMGVFGKKVWDATNHCLLYRRKTVVTKCLDVQNLPSGASGTNVRWYGSFHAGHGARALQARIILAPVDNASATDAETHLTIGVTDTWKIHQNYEGLADTHDNFSLGLITAAITSDSVVTWSVTAIDYARPIAIEIHELGGYEADTADGGVDPRIGQASPLLDSSHKQLHEAQTEMWKTNACHLYSWSTDGGKGVAPTFNDGTYTNIWDATTTGGASVTTPHIVLETTYHNTVGSTNVPIVFAVRAERTSGSDTCTVQLVDDGNNQLAVTGAITADGWYTATANLTAGTIIAAVEVACAGDPASVVRLDAVSIWEHE